MSPIKTATNINSDWRDEAFCHLQELGKRMGGTSTSDNRSEVEKFLSNSVALRPETLIISDLKWKYLMRSIVRGKNIMMTGPSGCGKTLAVQAAAGALSNMEITKVVSEEDFIKMKSNPNITVISCEEV